MMLLILSFFSRLVFAASCCGGGTSFPGLITGDYKAQISSSLSHKKDVARAYTEGDYTRNTDDYSRLSSVLSIQSSYMYGEFSQIGLDFTVIQKENSQNGRSEKETNLGDLGLTLAHEFLPETGFSWWKPRGIVFVKQIFPTGKSNFETEKLLSTDVTGKGQWTSEAGVAFIKIIRWMDIQAMGLIGNRFKEKFNRVEIGDAQFFSSLLSIGVSPYQSKVRLGFGLKYFYETSKKVSFGENESITQSEFHFDTSFNLSYAFSNGVSTSVNYSDQTLIGPAQNTTLSRSVSFLISKKWSL